LGKRIIRIRITPTEREVEECDNRGMGGEGIRLENVWKPYQIMNYYTPPDTPEETERRRARKS